jgi:hypothetical protein
MSAPKCPTCGGRGQQSGRIYVAVGQLELTVDGKRSAAEGNEIDCKIYRCRNGHRWEAPTAAAFNSSMHALFARVKGGR